MVVVCGTATTIDFLSADGVFKGGMIMPGLG
jgi:type III pantothenate kinase